MQAIKHLNYKVGPAALKPTAYAFIDETGLHFQGLKPASEWSGVPYQILRNAAACLCMGIPARDEVASVIHQHFPELSIPRRFAGVTDKMSVENTSCGTVPQAGVV